jgi:hypothetical protein
MGMCMVVGHESVGKKGNDIGPNATLSFIGQKVITKTNQMEKFSLKIVTYFSNK